MPQGLITDTHLTSIANAIRYKLDVQDSYTPAEMAPAILRIPSEVGAFESSGLTQKPEMSPPVLTTYSDANQYLSEVNAEISDSIEVYDYLSQEGLSISTSGFSGGSISVVNGVNTLYASDSSNGTCSVSPAIPSNAIVLVCDMQRISGRSGTYNTWSMGLHTAHGTTGQYSGNYSGTLLRNYTMCSYSGTVASILGQAEVTFQSKPDIYSLPRQIVTFDVSNIDQEFYLGFHRCDLSWRVWSITVVLRTEEEPEGEEEPESEEQE